MLSQTAEYALRAVVCLAGAADQRLTTPEIAEQTQVPAGYLSKVLQLLGRAGLVRSQRGLGGGFTLARSTAEINILEVINAVDPIQRITTCPLGVPGHGIRLCRLHHRIDQALATVEEVFRATTVADLLDPAGDGALCSNDQRPEPLR